MTLLTVQIDGCGVNPVQELDVHVVLPHVAHGHNIILESVSFAHTATVESQTATNTIILKFNNEVFKELRFRYFYFNNVAIHQSFPNCHIGFIQGDEVSLSICVERFYVQSAPPTVYGVDQTLTFDDIVLKFRIEDGVN
jgi:hypothetical protein